MRGGQEVEIPYDQVDYSAGRTATQLTQEDRDAWYAELRAEGARRAQVARDALELTEQQHLKLEL